MARAITSLPVPVSPRRSTAQSAGPTVPTASSTALNSALEPIRLDGVPSKAWPRLSRCASSTVITFPLLLPFGPTPRPVYPRPLPRDPLTNVGGTILEFSSICFRERKESYGFLVHEKYVLKIDDHRLSFLFEGGPKRIHMLACDPPTYAEDHEIFSSNNSLDSASHEF